MRQKRNIFQAKEHGKTSEKGLNKLEVSNLLNKEFKIMIIKMLNELRRKMDEYNEKFNKFYKL